MAEQIESTALRLTWSEATWDQVVCGFPVIQITDIQVLGAGAEDGLRRFEGRRDEIGAGLVSCRLPHDRLRESMLLEDRGFRFIEMLYQPELSLNFAIPDFIALDVVRAREEDLPELSEIARTAFRSERFLMDHRLDPLISDRRFQNWVASSLSHPSQELHVVSEGGRRVAFFVTEQLSDGTCYWHLNAVAPNAQGQGLGRRAWMSMIRQAQRAGAHRVRTSIAARNFRVLNLYARLGFHFPSPQMTFHWVRES